MNEVDKMKIQKFRELIAKELGLTYEDEFQQRRNTKIKDKYSDPDYWKQASEDSRKRISLRYGKGMVK